MTGFTDPASIAGYADNAVKRVPGLRDLHKMVAVLLSEGAPPAARMLVLGAGGGMELKALAERQPDWVFDGVDPSPAMLDLARATLGTQAARVRWHEGLIDTAPAGPFDGATCLLTLHFLRPAERLCTLKQLHLRLKPGAPLVVAHHSFARETADPDLWLKRNAAFGIASGIAARDAANSIEAIRERLPVLSPQEDAALLGEAGFEHVELFYCAFTFRGWSPVREARQVHPVQRLEA